VLQAAAEPRGRVSRVPPGPGRPQPDRAPRADVRQHRRARARLGGRSQRGQDGQALGRSRGGFSTKTHRKTDLDGQPLDLHLTGGEASDSRRFDTLLDIGPDIAPRAVVTDKGCDAEANREAARRRGGAAARRRGICPVIPFRADATDRPALFPGALHRGHARIEQAIGRLKRFRRVAPRCEETAENYAALVAFACGLILAKSAHTA